MENKAGGCAGLVAGAFESVLTVMLIILAGIAMSAFLLIQGVNNFDSTAVWIAFTLIALSAFFSGVGFTLGVQQIGEGREAARDRREQERFRDNTKENLAVIQQMATAQAAQARAQAAQQLAQNRALLAAPGGDVVDTDFVEFNPALLSSLELED